jgi:hypothetical protein
MKKEKTGRKARAPKPKPPAALKIACPSCGAPPKSACILLTNQTLSRQTVRGQFEINATFASPAPHASRLVAFEQREAIARRPRHSAKP